VGAHKESGNRGGEARTVGEQDGTDASKNKDDTGLGSSLRSIYQHTVDEEIPSEMLDLLKRLD
jgi:hypothetical protein